MPKLASRRNRRAVGVQANPIPGEVWLTTFSTDGAAYVEFQLSQATNVQDTTDASLLSGWVWNYWRTSIGGMTSEVITRLESIAGGLRIYVPNIPEWDVLQPWALMWPEGQQLVRGVLGERLTSTAISNEVGTKDNCGLFSAVRSSGGFPPPDWTQQPAVVESHIIDSNNIHFTASQNLSGFGTVAGWGFTGSGVVSDVIMGASPNEFIVQVSGSVSSGNEVVIPAGNTLLGATAGMPLAPGTFRV
jgi:hypothetical protein